jgi:hypothetical protein
MATWRRVFLVAHVWLTAFTTLFAGSPHLRCKCPTEHVKLIFLVFPLRAGDCCRGACCATPPEEGTPQASNSPTVKQEQRQCCCCRGATRRNVEEGERHARLESLGCKRTLAEADPVLPSPQQTAGDSLIVGLFLPGPAPALLISPLQTGSSLPPWESHHLPPPTDLVINLRHFII